jgi:transcriptional regulator GlxA family with amidase domain
LFEHQKLSGKGFRMTLKIVVLLFDGFTMLDAVGPIEVLSLLPDVDIKVVAKTPSIIWPDNRAVPFIAPFGIANVRDADVLLIPGGPGSDAIENDVETLNWVRHIDAAAQWTCSVCTGALILAAAGLLKGKEATTHWSVLARLSEFGALPRTKRWVESGKVITAAGVSAGIDMALLLASRLNGDRAAQAIQLSIEYDPAPPFRSGSVYSAGPDVVSAIMDGTVEFNRAGRTRPTIPRPI